MSGCGRALPGLLLLVAAGTSLAGCGGPASSSEAVPGASPQRGHELIRYYGCGSCHRIGGVDKANGAVGPSLESFRSIRTIAGTLPNTVANATRWIEHPQRIRARTIMPDLGVTRSQARDIVSYLLSQ